MNEPPIVKTRPTVIHAPSSRSIAPDQWSADLVRAAQAMADGGALRLAAELCDALLADDRVQGCLLLLTRGFFGLDLSFEEGVGSRRRRAHKALEAEEDWWSALPESDLAQLVTWGNILGVGVGRLDWQSLHGRMIPRLEVWHPKHLRFDSAARRWWVATSAGEVEVQSGDGSWVLYTPGGREQPWAHGAWRAIARWWLLKKYALSDWGRHSEQAGGVKVATTQEGSESDRRKLANDLATLGQDAAVALPKGWDLRLVEVSANTFETFRAQVDSANAAIAIALCGQNLTSEVRGGSRAAAQVHQQVANAVLRGQAESLSTTIHDQILSYWAEFNFGSAEAAPWPVWSTDPPESDETLAATAKSVGEAIAALKTAGVAVDARAMAARFGVPLVGEGAHAEGCGCGSAKLSRTIVADDPRTPRERAADEYVDSLVDDLQARLHVAMSPAIRAILDSVSRAASYDELRASLEALRDQLDHSELTAVVEQAMELAGAAGYWSGLE
ncbi:MAG: DUF935 family protein [Polyangiales bacterium]